VLPQTESTDLRTLCAREQKASRRGSAWSRCGGWACVNRLELGGGRQVGGVHTQGNPCSGRGRACITDHREGCRWSGGHQRPRVRAPSALRTRADIPQAHTPHTLCLVPLRLVKEDLASADKRCRATARSKCHPPALRAAYTFPQKLIHSFIRVLPCLHYRSEPGTTRMMTSIQIQLYVPYQTFRVVDDE
jgi:hypothetical protein